MVHMVFLVNGGFDAPARVRHGAGVAAACSRLASVEFARRDCGRARRSTIRFSKRNNLGGRRRPPHNADTRLYFAPLNHSLMEGYEPVGDYSLDMSFQHFLNPTDHLNLPTPIIRSALSLGQLLQAEGPRRGGARPTTKLPIRRKLDNYGLRIDNLSSRQTLKGLPVHHRGGLWRAPEQHGVVPLRNPAPVATHFHHTRE